METTGSAGFRRCSARVRGRMPAGTTSAKCRVSAQNLVGPKIHTGECWLGVHGKAEKLIGFESRNRGDSVRLLPKFVAGKYRWRWTAGECWLGVHCPMAGFKTRSRGDTRETLTDSCRRQIEPYGECKRNYIDNLKAPGSNPGRALVR
jgi:hypothetical protein